MREMKLYFEDGNIRVDNMQDIQSANRNTDLSSMDKMKKLLSPGMRKKGVNIHRTFGVPLEDLMARCSVEEKVPYVVRRVCEHIRDKGFDTEGLFRINGSTRIVEKYRTSFDMRGDVDFYEEEDLMAVAGLLKLFLREIPNSLIPENKTQQFVRIQEEFQSNSISYIYHLKQELLLLPEDHFNLLRYLIRFLVVVSQFEKSNKMSPMSLAIVFGPNIFRCGQGIVGLKDQGKINQIVFKFITHYDALFKEEGEISPQTEWIKVDQYDSTQYQDIEDHSEESSSHTQGRSHSPRFSDDEMAGRASPFILDSDGGFSMIESPQPSARTSEFVENVISKSIKEHLFGDDISMCETFVDEDSKENLDTALTVKERIKSFEATNEQLGKQKILKNSSWSTSHTEDKTVQEFQPIRMNGYRDDQQSHDEELQRSDEFESIKRDSGTLSSLQFKKPSGPRNRRSPSRRVRSDSEEKEIEVKELEVDMLSKTEKETMNIEINQEAHDPHPKPRVAFLELTNHSENTKSPDGSPNNGRKPFIPPLDLSTLHEHIDSSDAIPAHKGQSVSYMFAKSQINGSDGSDVVISPRNTKLIKRKANVPSNTDIPPSPPVHQDDYNKHSTNGMDNDMTTKLKQQSKKLHALKKKIKHFEENFERENGYKPSLADKASKPTIKKWMNDISKAKREIKRLKEEAEMGNRSRHGSGASSSGERLEPPDLPPSMEHTLNVILGRLEEKRKDAKRPEDTDLMDSDQIQDEKLAVQKALLYFENIHGRPKTREEKDLMRPLYDRYRKIKRLLSKPSSPRDKKELQTVPEDEPIELDTDHRFSNQMRMPVHIPSTHMDDGEDMGTMGTVDFAVTRDFTVLRDTVRPVSKEITRNEHSPKVKRKLQLPDDDEEDESQEPNLHEMSIPELQDELIKSRSEKKRIRRTLRNFEEDFFQKNGRRVQRDDREPLQSEYSSYKQIKAKLKLLEALLSKFENTDDV